MFDPAGVLIIKQALTGLALSKLVQDLTRRGNELSPHHRAALAHLVDSFTEYATGEIQGRRAYALPTGCGKTSAIAAWVAASVELGHRIPVSIAASRVEALCSLRNELVRLGVPLGLIGILHSVPDAEHPSTGMESRLIQLVTHVRIHSSHDEGNLRIVGFHEGKPRALCFFDESFFRSDSEALEKKVILFAANDLESRLVANEEEDPSWTWLPTLKEILGHAREQLGTIDAALKALRTTDAPHQGCSVDLRPVPTEKRATWQAALTALDIPYHYRKSLGELWGFGGHGTYALPLGASSGILVGRELVPQELGNIAVLDASHPIRELAQMDPQLLDGNIYEPGLIKDYSQLKVVQLITSGSRTKVDKYAGPMAKEVADLVKLQWEKPGGVLIFTYKEQAIGYRKKIEAALARAKVDIEATVDTMDDTGATVTKPKLNWLTWGMETSRNGYEFCTTVILAGVLHRSELDIAAAIKAQAGNPLHEVTSETVTRVLLSERAYRVQQAASRGSCRRSTGGLASAMDLFILDRDPEMEGLIRRVMHGCTWNLQDPKHMLKAIKRDQALVDSLKILAYLRGLPAEVQRVSSMRVKEALRWPEGKSAEVAFTRAAAKIQEDNLGGWKQAGRGFDRN